MLLRVCRNSIIVLVSYGLRYLPQLARGAKTMMIHSSTGLKEFCKQSQIVYSCFSSGEIEITDCLILHI